MTIHLDRAHVLLAQSRHDLAEKELRQELSGDADNAMAHALLALCLGERKEFDEATQEAKQAIALAPDEPYFHYVLASVLDLRDWLDEAEASVKEAIRLDPQEPDYFSLQASIHFQQRRWQDALESAELGLQIDAEHVESNNMRAMALVKLGRKAEAGQTIESALARDPDNAITHANQGWTLLEQRQHVKAMEHFREALRLDPDLEWARAGIVEALKARHFIYRWMLMYFFWMSKLSYKVQWALVIGGYIGQRILRQLANDNPAWAPLIWPVIIAYLAFVIMTWTATPLFNLLLRLNRFGRLALSREQIAASNWFGACILTALTVAALAILTNEPIAFLAALGFGLLGMSVAGAYHCRPGWPRIVMAVYSGMAATAGAGGLLLIYSSNAMHGRSAKLCAACGVLLIFVLFFAGAFSTWLANGLMMARPRR